MTANSFYKQLTFFIISRSLRGARQNHQKNLYKMTRLTFHKTEKTSGKSPEIVVL